MQGINISEWLAIGGIVITGVGAWVKLQKDMAKFESDLNNLKEDFHDERQVNRESLNEIKAAINEIKTFLLNNK